MVKRSNHGFRFFFFRSPPLPVVCSENAGQHLGGNCYIKFEEEEMAQKALQGIAGRFYAGNVFVVDWMAL